MHTLISIRSILQDTEDTAEDSGSLRQKVSLPSKDLMILAVTLSLRIKSAT